MATDPEPTQKASKYKLADFLHQVTSLPGIVSIAVIMAMLFIYFFAKSTPGQVGIANVDYARGMITLLFTVGTVIIALLLTLSAIFLTGSDAKERFDRGKEVLSLLIGIFGTIIGFYFGSASQGTPPNASVPVQQQERLQEVQPVDSRLK
jgi:hypothetical protein